MRKKAISMLDVKNNIKELKGKTIELKIDKGRKKYVNQTGTVIDAFPSVFTLKLAGEEGVLSCSYSDIICGVIEIMS